MRSVGDVAGMEVEERCIQGCGGEKLRERNPLGDPGVDGRIILK